MKQIAFLLILVLQGTLISYAAEPDLLVTQEGESLKVYNLDITPGDNVYYSDEKGNLHKISKADILIIKKVDGTKIDPQVEPSNSPNQLNSLNSDIIVPAISFEEINKIIGGNNKKEGTNMTEEEMLRYADASGYDIIFDFSEADINHFNISDFLVYYKPQSGMPAESLLDQFGKKIIENLNKGIKEYQFSGKDTDSKNDFAVVVKFREITEKAQSKGYVFIIDKNSKNSAWRAMETRAGRWNDFDILLMEDAESPYVNAPDKWSIQTVAQAIEYTTWNFRKSGMKSVKKNKK